MSRSLSLLSAAILLAASVCRADDNQFVRPRIGYVFDASSRQIRPLTGIPGSALVGAGVPLDFELDRALVSSANSFAIAAAADASKLRVIRLLEDGPVVTAIPDSFGAYDLGTLSRSGKAAILYRSDCRCFQILSGLPEAPQVARSLTLPQDESVVQALVITDDATKFAIAKRMGDRSEVVIYSPETSSAQPFSANALAFSPDGNSLALVDTERKSVSVLRDGNLIEVATEREGLITPVAAAFASPNRIIVADRESRVHSIAADGSGTTSTDCSCMPSAVETTLVEDTFRISELASGALWITQLTDGNARAMFIPEEHAPVPASEGGK